MAILPVGTRIEHDRYGEGIVARVSNTSYSIIFIRGGEQDVSIGLTNELEVLETPEDAVEISSDGLSFDDVENVIWQLLDKYNGLQEEVPLGDRWIGGKVIMNPKDASTQSKEVPMETFFHKIVMVRDRLRVLEQNINSHKKLDAEDKVHLQQYITRAYGSLTTFNVLFKYKDDHFKGAGK